MRLHLCRAVLGIAALALASPSFAKDEPAEATVTCKDGSISKAGRGACRGHGGVDKAASKKAAGGAAATAAETKGKKAREPAEERSSAKAATAAKAEEKAAGTTVVCKDGSTSKGGRGACRGHGGVDKGATARGGGVSAVSPATPSAPAPAAPSAPAPATPSAPAPAAPPASAAAAPPRVAPPPARSAAPPPAQRAPTVSDEKGPPTARCNDGTFSYAQHHTGACSRHGGVAEWLDKK